MGERTVCFGELLLRLQGPGRERLLQSQSLEAHWGGAEANVAVSLARFGHRVSMVSAVPRNPLGRQCIAALKAQGVDTAFVRESEGRMGLYFLEPGAVLRPSRVIYDRAHSSFAATDPSEYDWEQILDGATRLHISGITPAVGPGPAQAACAAVEVATHHGVSVSFDGNYRQALWRNWGGDGPSILKRLLSHAELAFIDERDVALVLDEERRRRAEAMEQIFALCPRLAAVATTRRVHGSVTQQVLTGEYYERERLWTSQAYGLDHVVDRIGGGDAFAAGVLHGRSQGFDAARTIEFAAAASALKHSIPGDWNLVSTDEIDQAVEASSLDVQR